VLADVKAWQSRPLASVYPILYCDALSVKSREAGPVKNKALYLALGVNLHGEKERLSLWIADTEGAKFWLKGLYRAEKPGRAGWFHRLCGRAQGTAGSHRSRVSQHPSPTVYRP
jgi:transposase-like protein